MPEQVEKSAFGVVHKSLSPHQTAIKVATKQARMGKMKVSDAQISADWAQKQMDRAAVKKSFVNFSGKAVPISQLSRVGRMKLKARIKADKMSRAKTGKTVGGNMAAAQSKVQHAAWDERLRVGREASERSIPSGLKNINFDQGVSSATKEATKTAFPKGTKKKVTVTEEIPGGQRSMGGMMAAGMATSTPNKAGFRTIHINQPMTSVSSPSERAHFVAHEYAHVTPRRGANPGRINNPKRSMREEGRADTMGAKTTGQKGTVIPGGYDGMAAKQVGELPAKGVRGAIGRMLKPNMGEYTKMRAKLGKPVDTSIRADITRAKTQVRSARKAIKDQMDARRNPPLRLKVPEIKIGGN